MKKTFWNVALASALSAGFVVSPSAAAADVFRTYAINATGNCNGALPAFESALRKRPTAIANQGAATAFVNCSLPGDVFSSGNVQVQAGFINRSAMPIVFSCTFVDGVAEPFRDGGGPVFHVQQVALDASAAGGIAWAVDDPMDGPRFSPIANLSCALPPGVEIAFMDVSYLEDNGASSNEP